MSIVSRFLNYTCSSAFSSIFSMELTDLISTGTEPSTPPLNCFSFIINISWSAASKIVCIHIRQCSLIRSQWIMKITKDKRNFKLKTHNNMLQNQDKKYKYITWYMTDLLFNYRIISLQFSSTNNCSKCFFFHNVSFIKC